MRKIGAIFGIAALAAVVLFPLPAAAFGFHLGRFYFHLPLVGHHYRHHPTRASRNEARTRPNNVSRSGGDSTAAHGRDATEQPDREARAETNTAALESCIVLKPGLTNLPIDQIRQTVHPTADQEAALDNLSAASAQASEIIKSSCPASIPLTPIGRMDAAEQRLDATIKAIQMLLSPLEKFYEALSDEQRERFNAMNGSSEGARSPSDMAALCSQQAGSFIDLPAQRVEQVVQPTAQQQSAFDDLKKAAQKVGDQLQSSCPTAVPKSPVARFKTIETRLGAVAHAIKAIRPTLKNFYASLSDEQKARFNMMGPAPLPASSPQ
jgi:ABC-type transporter MlaC component